MMLAASTRSSALQSASAAARRAAADADSRSPLCTDARAAAMSVSALPWLSPPALAGIDPTLSSKPLEQCVRSALRRIEMLSRLRGGIAAVFLRHRVRERQTQHRLADDRCRRHRADVAAYDRRRCGCARREVDGCERLHERRDRLDTHAHDEILAVRHAALDAAGAIASAPDAAVGRFERIVRLAADVSASRDALSDLNRLDGLDAHHRRRYARAEPMARLTVAADPDRHSRRSQLERSAERVANFLRAVDPFDHERGRRSVRTPHGRIAHTITIGQLDDVPRAHVPDLKNEAAHCDAEHSKVLPRDLAESDAHRRLARARALQDVAQIGVPELQAARVVGMTRTRPRDRLTAARQRIHERADVLEVPIADDDRKRRPEGHAASQPGEEFDPVVLDLLPATAAVTALTRGERGVDRRDIKTQACRYAVDDPDERRTVRFARGHVSDHESLLMRSGRRFADKKTAGDEAGGLVVLEVSSRSLPLVDDMRRDEEYDLVVELGLVDV